MHNTRGIIKYIAKRIVALLLVLFMVFGFAPEFSLNGEGALKFGIVRNPLMLIAHAATSLSTGIDGLTASYDGGTWTVSGTTITGSAASTKSSGSGCNASDTYLASTGTLTLTNSSGTAKTLSFTYGESNGGEFAFSGATTVKPDNEQVVRLSLAAGASLTVKVTSHSTNTDKTTVTLSGISFSSAVSVTTTFRAPTNGSYKVGSTVISADTQMTQNSTQAYSVVATPNANYIFDGWYVNNVKMSSFKSASLTLTANSTVEARFTIDPLYSIATVSGSSAAKDTFIESDSSYYHGIVSSEHSNVWRTNSSKGKDGYDTVYKDDLPWNLSGTEIVSSGSGISTGDFNNNSTGQSNAPAFMYSDVIRVKALKNCDITYQYSLYGNKVEDDGNDKNAGPGLFLYQLVSSNGSVSVGSIASASNVKDSSTSNTLSGTATVSVNQGEYLYILAYCWTNANVTYIRAGTGAASNSYSCSSTISSFTITPNSTEFTVSSHNIDNTGTQLASGTVKVNETAQSVASGYSTSAVSGTEYIFEKGTAPSGYQFIGWRVTTNGTTTNYYGLEKYQFNLDGDYQVDAIYVPNMTITAGGTDGYGSASYTYGNGTAANGQYVARNANWTLYTNLADAFSANSTVILLANDTISGDFTVPSEKTLVIPYGLADQGSTSVEVVETSGAASAYCTLTMNGNLTINGNLVVGGRQSSNGNGYTTGGAGILVVSANKTVTVNNGANLCAFGFVRGDGQITVNSGGTVYEFMAISAIRSLQVLQTMAGEKKVFPFPNYYIRNIASRTTYLSGANLKARYATYISAGTLVQQAVSGEMTVFGSSGAMFNFSSGSITKYVDAEKNKTIFQINNGTDVSTGSFSISMSVSGYPIEIDTKDYYLPLNYTYGFAVEDGAKLTLNDDYILLPGASIDIKEGGELEIASTGNLVLYRLNDYDTRSSGAADGVVQGYSPNGVVPAAPSIPGFSVSNITLNNVGSAVLNVDGTATVLGGLYVTNDPIKESDQGLGEERLTKNASDFATPKSNGYSILTGTGTINMTNAKTNVTKIQEVMQKSNSTSPVYDDVTIATVKGLTNYDAATDDGQTDYNSFTKTTWYGYINDNDVNVWSTAVPVTLSYNANGGDGEAPKDRRVPSGIAVATAANPFTRTNYTFQGWNTAADGSGTAPDENGKIAITANTTLYAQWKTDGYIVSFNMQGHGEQIEEIVAIEANSYKIAAPAAPAESGWIFGGWYKEEECTNAWDFSNNIVTEDVELFAKWTEKATPAVGDFTVSGNTVTYDAAAHSATVTGAEGMGEITVKYYQGTTEVADPINAGEYTVKVDVAEGDAFKAATELVVGTLTINKRAATVTAKAQTVALNGSIATDASQATLIDAVSGHTLGAVTLTGSSTANATTNGIITPSAAAIMSGSTDVTANYNISYVSGTLTVEKATPQVTAPTAETGLTYTGNGQTLVEAGSTTAGTLQYKLNNGEYGTAIPTATNAGTYTVYYRVVGNDNYNDVAEASVSVTIAKQAVTAPTIGSKVYTGSTLTADVTATALYVVTKNEGGTDVGSYDVVLTLTDSDNHKWSDSDAAAKTLIFQITKAGQTAPAGLTATAETYCNQGNGAISGVTSAMEYRTEANGSYTAITGTRMENLAAGTYYVRFKADANHEASPTTTVTVGEGAMIVITWKNGDATLGTSEVRYDETPVYNGTLPTKAATPQYTYTFSGWTPEVEPATGPKTYTATFTSTVNTYTVTWKNADGTVLETDKNVAYGATPSYDGATPTKTVTGYTYTFTGWTPEIDSVTGDATYTAVFDNGTPNTATVTVNYHVDISNITYEPMTFTYSYDQTLDNPTLEYCSFLGWTYGEVTEPCGTENLRFYLNNLIESKNESVNVTAHFQRLKYTVSIFSQVNGSAPEAQATNVSRNLGYTTVLNAPATMGNGNEQFSYWKVAEDKGENGQPGDDEVWTYYYTQRAPLFPSTPGHYLAIACYGYDDQTSSDDNVSLRIVKENVEQVGNSYRALVTVEVFGPENGYRITDLGVKYLLADKVLDGNGDFQGYVEVPGKDGRQEVSLQAALVSVDKIGSSLKEIVNDNHKTGFTYTFRLPMTEPYFFTYAYLNYTVNEKPHTIKVTIDKTYKDDTQNHFIYDIIDRPGS